MKPAGPPLSPRVSQDERKLQHDLLEDRNVEDALEDLY